MGSNEQFVAKVRRMERSDIGAVLALERKIGKGHSRISYKDMVATDLEGPLDLSFVAESDGQLRGFLLARLAYVGIPLGEVCIIHGIVVDPDYQRHGIGGKLVNALVDHCHAEGINTIRALIEEGNAELRLFAEQMGFRRSKITNYDKTFES
ncbi:MAG: GNAT family N-acetyltransferase [Chloroflexi bacterium]|nr:GNAT family N-acetyltransferase [Chloroflexota bacterium]